MTNASASARRKPTTETTDRTAQIGTIKDILGNLKPRATKQPSISNKQAVLQIRRPVLEARDKGYSWDEIHDIVSRNGLKITKSTMQSYLQPGRERGAASAKEASAETANGTAASAVTAATAPVETGAKTEPAATGRKAARRLTSRGRTGKSKAAKSRKPVAETTADAQA